MQTLAYDHLIEDAGLDLQGETLYVAARRGHSHVRVQVVGRHIPRLSFSKNQIRRRGRIGAA